MEILYFRYALILRNCICLNLWSINKRSLLLWGGLISSTGLEINISPLRQWVQKFISGPPKYVVSTDHQATTLTLQYNVQCITILEQNFWLSGGLVVRDGFQDGLPFKLIFGAQQGDLRAGFHCISMYELYLNVHAISICILYINGHTVSQCAYLSKLCMYLSYVSILCISICTFYLNMLIFISMCTVSQCIVSHCTLIVHTVSQCALSLNVHTISQCVHCLNVHTASQCVPYFTVFQCAHCILMYTLYLNVHTISQCTHGISMCTLYLNVHTVSQYAHYLVIYIYDNAAMPTNTSALQKRKICQLN